MSDTLGMTVEQGRAAFTDYINQNMGMGCQATAQGDGRDFESIPVVAAELGATLEAQGWQNDQQYQADSPMGTATAFRKDKGLCLVSVNWVPAEGADCPDDQPLAACELAPEQKMYTVVINCARGE